MVLDGAAKISVPVLVRVHEDIKLKFKPLVFERYKYAFSSIINPDLRVNIT